MAVNQQHTVCSETSTVAPTPSLASGAQQGQGESAECQCSLYPSKKKDNATGQCATAAAPTLRMDTPPHTTAPEPLRDGPCSPCFREQVTCGRL
ncbi:hypothetical protein E2C01_093987 [Portunus trituberculatus]|uniref:Uncharacterized protein n=1 Tax=Portunus trituberculatus TaxID=210409 RepID=A0A5B7JW14_PORTR|nr:hypothetical protein [Portunus trituberculatus]